MAKNTMTFTDNRTGKSYEYNIIDGTRGPTLDILQQQLVSQKLLL